MPNMELNQRNGYQNVHNYFHSFVSEWTFAASQPLTLIFFDNQLRFYLSQLYSPSPFWNIFVSFHRECIWLVSYPHHDLLLIIYSPCWYCFASPRIIILSLSQSSFPSPSCDCIPLVSSNCHNQFSSPFQNHILLLLTVISFIILVLIIFCLYLCLINIDLLLLFAIVFFLPFSKLSSPCIFTHSWFSSSCLLTLPIFFPILVVTVSTPLGYHFSYTGHNHLLLI